MPSKKKNESQEGMEMKRKAKKRKKNEQQYSLDDMLSAIDDVHKGVSLTQAAKTFNVPKSTLSHKLRHLTPIDCKKGP